jgi:hypothetical protein
MASILHSWDRSIHRGIEVQDSKVVGSGDKMTNATSGFGMAYQISKGRVDGSEVYLSARFNEYTL